MQVLCLGKEGELEENTMCQQFDLEIIETEKNLQQTYEQKDRGLDKEFGFRKQKDC